MNSPILLSCVIYSTEKLLLNICRSLKNGFLLLVGTDETKPEHMHFRTMQIPPLTRRNVLLLGWKAAGGVAGETVYLNGNLLLGTDTVGDQSEIPIGRNKRKDSLRLPAFEPNTRMEADVIQQPWVLEGVAKR